MTKHLTGEEIRKVVGEISALETHAIATLGWQIVEVNHLYFLPVELYLVHFHNDVTYLYAREGGKLDREAGWSYYASNNFEDMHRQGESAGARMTNTIKVRVHFIDGSERVVPAINIHWVGEEGARAATALVDGREVPIYKRSEPEWGPLWYEQLPLVEFGDERHGGVCAICERDVTALNDAGVCEGCVMQAMIDGSAGAE